MHHRTTPSEILSIRYTLLCTSTSVVFIYHIVISDFVITSKSGRRRIHTHTHPYKYTPVNIYRCLCFDFRASMRSEKNTCEKQKLVIMPWQWSKCIVSVQKKKNPIKLPLKAFCEFFVYFFDFLSGFVAIQVFELQLRIYLIDIVESVH